MRYKPSIYLSELNINYAYKKYKTLNALYYKNRIHYMLCILFFSYSLFVGRVNYGAKLNWVVDEFN